MLQLELQAAPLARRSMSGSVFAAGQRSNRQPDNGWATPTAPVRQHAFSQSIESGPRLPDRGRCSSQSAVCRPSRQTLEACMNRTRMRRGRARTGRGALRCQHLLLQFFPLTTAPDPPHRCAQNRPQQCNESQIGWPLWRAAPPRAALRSRPVPWPKNRPPCSLLTSRKPRFR